ncbi:MAG: class IV adenylate cyclase [Phycisphaerae bacterium]|jgi:predicted adenylyl cyclase CyaB
MATEIEMKFNVPSHRAVARRLRQLRARRLYTAVQRDRYFDTPQHRLLKADCGLRLRETRCLRAGTERPELRTLLTFKGPRRGRSAAKVRAEHQTFLDEPALMGEIFTACGLTGMLTIEKKRSSFRLGRCKVELDELPLLGCFVEIEGPAEAAVQAVREKLGLETALPLKDHYIGLARAACRRLGRQCREMTFANCQSCRRGGK